MQKQRALLIIKPDGVQRGIIGKIITRFETVGLKIIGLKFEWVTKEKIIVHYPETDGWFKKVG
ncbi:nucleoside-diphosphate kinase, partial [Candidatus Roizmanbacteria bacterium CG_4_9_14_0_2_um_filter_35_15]